MEELFWKYIDEQSTEAENQEVERLLESNENARVLMAQLKKLDSSLDDLTHQPSAAFTPALLTRIFPAKALEYASFKPVLYIFLSLLLASTIVSLIPSSAQTKSSLLENFMQQLNLEFSRKYLIFGLTALSAIAVLWFDLLYHRIQTNSKK